MKNIFELTVNSIKNLFSFVPKLTGPQGDAVSTIQGHYTAIGEILAKGSVTPEMGELALRSLYHSQIVVNQAVTFGWNGGTKTNY